MKTLTPVIPDKPSTFDSNDIVGYTISTDPTKNVVITDKGVYCPPVGSGVWINNVLYKVISYDPNTFVSTIVQAYIEDGADGDNSGSTISYNNEKLRFYLNTKSVPYRGIVDPGLIIYNDSPAYYTLYRHPFDPQKIKQVSKYYDASGKFTNNFPPMELVENSSKSYACGPCYISEDLDDNERLKLVVFDETGVEIFSAYIFVKYSQIINDAFVFHPRITSFEVRSPQMMDDGTIYLYQKQPISSLDLYGIVHYEDGSSKTVQVDGVQTKLFGESDFVPSYSGMRQQMMMIYYLGQGEEVANGQINQQNVNQTFDVLVRANSLATPVKISPIPVFNQNANQYALKFFMYSTSRNRVIDVTNYTTIENDGFIGNDYVHFQQFDITTDMTQVDSSLFQDLANYTQSMCIKLLPDSQYVRWVISDSQAAPIQYGADGSNNRRPVLYYDSLKNAYFVPSSIFQNKEAFLQSFYWNARPPYDTRIESAAPTPTHFGIRNPYTGILLSKQPIDSYQNAFQLTQSIDFTGQTVIVEFSQVTENGEYIIYGVPVDVNTGTYVN